jgi:hypothetical protein
MPGQIIFRREAKIAPWWLAHRDSFSAKAVGEETGWASPPTLSAHTRWPLTIIRLNFNTFGFPHCK